MKTVSPLPEIRALRLREFRFIRRLVYDEAGIHLPDSKHTLVESRLARRIRELGLRNYEQYCELIGRDGDADERVRMLDCITTNETHFFREPKHFDFLERTAFPRWHALASAGAMPRRLRVWSAACSTGEEPYSLAMCLLHAFPRGSGWEIELFASDLSTRALDRAHDATWSIDKAKEIPEPYLKRYMLRGVGASEGQLRCGPELRALVRFARINLNCPPYPIPGQLDLIMCRNVLIYFDQDSKTKVIHNLLDRVSPHGFLMVGHSESLHGVTGRVRALAPSIYVQREAGDAR